MPPSRKVTRPDIVNGVFIDNTIGSLFYNYMSIDFTGVPGVDNNPQFGFRIVNAATEWSNA